MRAKCHFSRSKCHYSKKKYYLCSRNGTNKKYVSTEKRRYYAHCE